MPRKARKPATHGTGWHLHKLVVMRLHIDFWEGCGCKELAAEMDRHPPAWSLKPRNFTRIVNKMRAAAKRAPNWKVRLISRMPGVTFPIRSLVREAVRLAQADLEIR
jgi:hypothetical protein